MTVLFLRYSQNDKMKKETYEEKKISL